MQGNQRTDLYISAYLADYGFESVMVHYRRRFLLERLALHRPAIVVEVGCGSELLYESWLQAGGRAECWVIVEPAGRFAEAAIASSLPNLSVVSEFFENAVPQLRALLPRPPDLVICSGLLHEVPSATALLSSMASIMGERYLPARQCPER